MKILIFGASGATGKLLVNSLIKNTLEIIIILRPTSVIPEEWNNYNNLLVIRQDINSMEVPDLYQYIANCDAVVSCLGHNITFKGIFGHPRKLVTDTITKIYTACNINSFRTNTKKLILMNTVGVENREISEKPSVSQRIITSILKRVLPPFKDSYLAAEFLRTNIGMSNPKIEWVIVRPDSLIDENEVTDYNLYTSPIRNVIFNPGKTSRINVADFMKLLLIDKDLWNNFKFQMPVIYNK